MQRFGWSFNEMTNAGEEHLDPEYVMTYDRKAGADPSEDMTVLRELGIGEDSVVVDLGAGTGTFALTAAPLCRRLVAVDVSPAMLAALHSKAEHAGLTNVETAYAGLLSYEHQGEPAGFVYSRNTLHHLPDFWKMIALTRIHAMLEPGGVLRLHDLVFSFEPQETVDVIEGWLDRAPERSEDGWTRSELETHIREEYSTFSWLLEPMLERAGFEIRDATYRPTRTFAAYTCVKR